MLGWGKESNNVLWTLSWWWVPRGKNEVLMLNVELWPDPVTKSARGARVLGLLTFSARVPKPRQNAFTPRGSYPERYHKRAKFKLPEYAWAGSKRYQYYYLNAVSYNGHTTIQVNFIVEFWIHDVIWTQIIIRTNSEHSCNPIFS